MRARKTIDHNDTELALHPNRRAVLEYIRKSGGSRLMKYSHRMLSHSKLL